MCKDALLISDLDPMSFQEEEPWMLILTGPSFFFHH